MVKKKGDKDAENGDWTNDSFFIIDFLFFLILREPT